VAAVKANAEIAERYDRRVARDGQLYFVLKAGNGEIVGVSEMYTSTAAREQGGSPGTAAFSRHPSLRGARDKDVEQHPGCFHARFIPRVLPHNPVQHPAHALRLRVPIAPVLDVEVVNDFA
jgi:uncharacterized protein YegP (UPF0339 family)